MSTGGGLRRSIGALASATLASRLLGFLKATLLVAAIGGTSSAVGGQAFEVANAAPMNLFNLLAGGILTAVLVPQIVRAHRLGVAGTELIQRLLTLSMVGAVGITVALVLAAPLIVWLYATRWSDDWLRLTTAMAYWCAPQVFFLCVFGVFGQVLNARSQFAAAAWAPALSNLIGIVGIVVFLLLMPSGLGPASSWSPLMVAVLCGSATLGSLAQAALVVASARSAGFRFRPRLGLGGLGKLGVVASWTFLGVAAGQVAYLLVSNVATAAGEQLNRAGVEAASVNSLSVAYLLVLVPHGVVVVAIATALYGRISHAAAAQNYAHLAALTRASALSVTWVMVPASVALIVLGPVFSSLIWGEPTIGQITGILAVGMLGFSQAFVLNRASFALEDGRGPFATQLVVAVVTASGALIAATWLPPAWVVPAIAGSVSIANYIGWAVAHRAVAGRFLAQSQPLRGQALAHLRLVLAGIAATLAGVVPVVLMPTAAWWGQLLVLVVGAMAITAVFLVTSWLMGDRTIRHLRIR